MAKKKKQSKLTYEKVMALSQTDLKKQMRKVNIGTVGLEKDLRKHLLDHLKLAPPAPAKDSNGEASETKDTTPTGTTTNETQEEQVLAPTPSTTQPVGQSEPGEGSAPKETNEEEAGGGARRARKAGAGQHAEKSRDLTREQVEKLSGKELSEHLKALGLTVGGKVSEKKERLLKHHGINSVDDVDVASGEAPETAGTDEEADDQAKSKDAEAEPKEKPKTKPKEKVTEESSEEDTTGTPEDATESDEEVDAGRVLEQSRDLTREQVEKLSGKELSEHLKALGLTVGGKVSEKKERLLKHHGLDSGDTPNAAGTNGDADEQAKSKDAEAEPKKKPKTKSAEKVAKVSNTKAAKDGIESGDDAKKQQPETTPEPKKKKEIKEKKKRPLSGYLIFSGHVREETKKELIANAEGVSPFEGKELSQAIMKAVGAKWKALSDEEKTKWKNTEQPQSSKDTNADAPSTSSPPVAAAKDDGGEDAKKKKKEKKKKKKEKKRKETEINIEDAIDTERATPSPDATTTNKAPNSNSTPTKKAEKDTEAGKSQTKKRKKADKKSPSEPAEKVAKVSNAKAAKDGIESGDDAKQQQPETTPEPKKKKEKKEKKKRPLSGYLMFLGHVRDETKKEVIANAEGGAPFEGTELNQAIMKAGAAKWKALSDEEKTKWKNTEQPQSSKDTNADAPSTSSPPVATGGDDAKEKRQKKKRKRKSKGKSDATETTDDLPTPEQKEGTPRGHEQAVEKSTGNEGEQISWTDDFSRFDFRCSHISYLSELSTQAPIDNFFKGAKWSPDGFLLLTASNDNCVRMFETPVEPSELVPSSSPNEEEVSELSQVGEHAVGGLIYDYAWYSRMATIDAASCCYAVSSRGNPVHLLDGATHKLRCTYKAHDSADELVSANSLAFHPDGELLVCGYKRSVVEFNLARPGMSDHAHSTLESGQRGIISTIDFSSASHSFVACGCYDGTIGFYDMNSGWGKSVQTLLGHERGVTQVMFDRYGNYLYSGGRRDGFVHCWDTRFVTKHPLYSLKRPGVIDTNQTIEFDIDPHNKYLISGGVDGTASVFDLNDGKKVKEVHVSEPGAAANGISINQSSQWSLYFAVSSGNYQFDRSTEADVSRVNSLKLYNISKRLV